MVSLCKIKNLLNLLNCLNIQNILLPCIGKVLGSQSVLKCPPSPCLKSCSSNCYILCMADTIRFHFKLASYLNCAIVVQGGSFLSVLGSHPSLHPRIRVILSPTQACKNGFNINVGKKVTLKNAYLAVFDPEPILDPL